MTKNKQEEYDRQRRDFDVAIKQMVYVRNMLDEAIRAERIRKAEQLAKLRESE